MQLVFKWLVAYSSLILSTFFLTSCHKTPPETAFELVSYPPAPVVRTYKTPVYLHYMPWFESPEYAEFPERDKGNWGAHWTMRNQNPTIQDASGKRQIAAHYYPLIGPYDNGEPHYLEYAVACMKLSGVDGVLIDFPGNTPVYDWKLLFDHTNALLPWLEKAGLRFGIVYEDKALDNAYAQGIISNRVQEAQRVMQYMQATYFSKTNYLQLKGAPVLLNFGPQAIFTDAEWNSVFSVIPNIQFITLPYTRQNYKLNTSVDGEFAWVGETIQNNFYQHASQYPITIGGAMPGFKDFYKEGGWGTGYTYYDDQGGALFQQTLQRAASFPIDLLQIITWNDFGEGTIVEPTREFGYTRLEQIQRFLGVTYTAKDLELAVRLYQKRKELRGDTLKNQQLDQVFYYLISLQVDKARTLLDSL